MNKYHPETYEFIKAATDNTAVFTEINGRTVCTVDAKAMYALVSYLLHVRDKERNRKQLNIVGAVIEFLLFVFVPVWVLWLIAIPFKSAEATGIAGAIGFAIGLTAYIAIKFLNYLDSN